MSDKSSDPTENDPVKHARRAVAHLLESRHSLVIASIDEAEEPLVSTCPFVRDGEDFLIAVSGLAAHGASLARGGIASVMLLEDEQQTRQPFARLRLSFRCEVQALPDPEARREVFEALHRRFGAVAKTLEQLGDFRAYRLRPLEGRFVMGFGAAFSFDGGAIEGMKAVRGS
jgi:putative heme iron utilization protein